MNACRFFESLFIRFTITLYKHNRRCRYLSAQRIKVVKKETSKWINTNTSKQAIVDDWQVDVAFDKSEAFSVGRLYITDQQIQIEAAGGLCHMGEIRDELPINAACNHLIARYDQIRSVKIQKQFLLLNYLILTLKSNHMLVLKFGFESAHRARQRIIERIA